MEPFLEGDSCGIEDIRHHMGGCDKVDIMATHTLEFEHHVCQIFILNFFSPSFMGDGPVLAEDTSKVTVGKENSTRPLPSHERHLFTKMGVITEDHWLDWSSTESLFTFLPIHPTLPGTELTIFEEGVSLFNSLSQFALHLQFLVGRNPLHIPFLSGMRRNG